VNQRKFYRTATVVALVSLVLIFSMLLMLNIILITTIVKTFDYADIAPSAVKNFLDTYALRVLITI